MLSVFLTPFVIEVNVLMLSSYYSFIYIIIHKLVFSLRTMILIMFFDKQLQDNIDLFCHTRHNINTILNGYVIFLIS